MSIDLSYKHRQISCLRCSEMFEKVTNVSDVVKRSMFMSKIFTEDTKGVFIRYCKYVRNDINIDVSDNSQLVR